MKRRRWMQLLGCLTAAFHPARDEDGLLPKWLGSIDRRTVYHAFDCGAQDILVFCRRTRRVLRGVAMVDVEAGRLTHYGEDPFGDGLVRGSLKVRSLDGSWGVCYREDWPYPLPEKSGHT